MCQLCDGSAESNEHDSRPGVSRRSLLAGLGGLVALGGVAACSEGGSQAGPSTVPSNEGATKAPLDARLAVVLLGTQAGPPIAPDRTGISTALVVDGATYVVDCGRSSATQYVRSSLRLEQLEGIFLTHLHADHIADFYNFFLCGGHIKNIVGDTIGERVQVYGPGPAGGLPPKFGGGTAPVVDPASPTPGTRAMVDRLTEAYAYSDNVFMRDMTVRDIRTLMDVHEIAVPDVGASYQNTAPTMKPFRVYEDDRLQVSGILVSHGPVYPSFAFRFDTDHGSVTFSGDTTETPNIPTIANGTDMLIHEAINVQGLNLSQADRDHMLQSHVEVQKVGAVAQAAQAKHLVLSHISNLTSPVDSDQWRRFAQQGYDGEVTVGSDLQSFVLA